MKYENFLLLLLFFLSFPILLPPFFLGGEGGGSKCTLGISKGALRGQDGPIYQKSKRK